MIENKSPRFFYGYIVVSAAFFIILVMWGTAYSFGVFFKPLLAEFGWTRAMTSGAFSLSFGLHGFCYIVTGRLTDRFGPRLVLTACGFLLGLGYLLMSQITAIWQLYLFYGVIVGIGMGGGFVPLVSTVARWFVKKRGLITGIVVSGQGMGTVIIPLLANWLISIYNWSTSYRVVGVIALVLIILAAQFLRRDPSQVGLLPYGANEVKAENSNLQASGFSLQEAIHTGQFWMLCAIFFCAMLCIQAIMVHIMLHATELGISAASAANILAIIGGMSIASRVIVGGASDRIGNKLAFIIIFVMMSLALFWLVVVKEIWMLYLFAVVFGFAWGGFSVLISPLVAGLFGLSSVGVISGAIVFVGTIGGAAGPVLAGGIFDMRDSYTLAFLACGVVSTMGLILTLFLGSTVTEGRNNSKRSA